MKETPRLKAIAQEVMVMEDSYDNSMEGYILKELVSEYVLCRLNAVVKNFDYVFENQTDSEFVYGDHDISVTKTERLIEGEHTVEVYKTLCINNLNNDEQYTLTKYTNTGNSSGDTFRTKFHIRKGTPETSTINDEGRLDVGFVLSATQYFQHERDLRDNHTAMKTYKHFYRASVLLYDVAYEIKHEEL